MKEVEYQFDAPSSEGHTLLPSSEGSLLGTRIGRPSGVSPVAQVIFLTYCVAEQKFAVGAIEYVEETVAVGLKQEFSGLALPVRVDQRRRFLRVPVPDVVGRELEMPFQFARLGVQRHDRNSSTVVADAIVAVSSGAGLPVGQ